MTTAQKGSEFEKWRVEMLCAVRGGVRCHEWDVMGSSGSDSGRNRCGLCKGMHVADVCVYVLVCTFVE
jgi:hypothetical protein